MLSGLVVVVAFVLIFFVAIPWLEWHLFAWLFGDGWWKGRRNGR